MKMRFSKSNPGEFLEFALEVIKLKKGEGASYNF